MLSDGIWQRIFELAGIIDRGESANLLAKTWANTGVIAFHVDSQAAATSSSVGFSGVEKFKIFLDAWIALTDKTLYWLRSLKQDLYFTETLSFVLALIEANVPYELLPVQLNCQLNMPLLDFQRNGYVDALTFHEPPAIVHYPLGTVPFDKFGYVGTFTPQKQLQNIFPFLNAIPLNHINQFFAQQGGTPFYHGSPAGVDFVKPLAINPILGPNCLPLVTKRYGLYWGKYETKAEDFEYDSAADNSEFPVRKSFLSLAHGYASEENYQMLLKDMALYCQSRKVWIDWYDEFHDNLRRMIEKREDLLLAIEQLLYYHVNERGGTRDDDTLVLKLYVTGPDYDIE